MDKSGNDIYRANQPDQAQGIGNDGDKREYGSMALLLDLAGRDSYACEAGDHMFLTRPSFGVVLDAGGAAP